MKKIITLVAVAAASLIMASKAHAQFGIIAGLTSSKVDATEAVKDVKGIVLYHAGLTYKIDLGAGFALQATFSDVGSDIMNKMEYGFGLGGGLEIASHVQLSVQWFKNLGAIINDGAAKSGEAWWNEVKGVKNFKGIKFSLAILF